MNRWILAGWVLLGGAAFGCSCAPSTPCSAYAWAEAVVMVKIGRALEVENGFVTKAEGVVTASWKGDIRPGRAVTVAASPWCNVAQLKAGESLLVYGFGLRGGNVLSTFGCGRKVSGVYADSDLRYLASVEAAGRLPKPLAVMQERWAAFRECFVRPIAGL